MCVQSICFLEGTTNTILILAMFGPSCIPIHPTPNPVGGGGGGGGVVVEGLDTMGQKYILVCFLHIFLIQEL